MTVWCTPGENSGRVVLTFGRGQIGILALWNPLGDQDARSGHNASLMGRSVELLKLFSRKLLVPVGFLQ